MTLRPLRDGNHFETLRPLRDHHLETLRPLRDGHHLQTLQPLRDEYLVEVRGCILYIWLRIPPRLLYSCHHLDTHLTKNHGVTCSKKVVVSEVWESVAWCEAACIICEENYAIMKIRTKPEM